MTSDNRRSSLEAALAATPTGGTLEVRRDWRRTKPLEIHKPVTLLFVGGAITQTTDANAIDVASSDVTIENAVLTGVGSTEAGLGQGISAVGTSGAPIDRLRILGGVIQGWRKDAVFLNQVTNFQVSGVMARSVAYAGIMVLSGRQGTILKNTVRDVTQPPGFVNSYGIAMTRDRTLSLIEAPRTSGVVVDGNTIDGVRSWEGIDTHGGTQLTISNNRVTDTRVGIAMVPCPDERKVGMYAPRGITVTENYIRSSLTDGTRKAGIELVGTRTEDANAVIANNMIVGNGPTEAAGSAGGIVAYFTRDAVISHNRIVDPGVAGVHLVSGNSNITILKNTVVAAWTDPGETTALLWVNGTSNTVNFGGNRFEAGGKIAADVDRYGVDALSSRTNVITDLGGNSLGNS
ncbi:right-handed parallel beta-helix repeat-containing protein [Diaminobutyricibacter sp. McL0618]|uniref:right-handed parallel beta-helix repeat-containing protein n=1 Tax=Leifsonia sp. McL0618 TaxID=3415677 RepID=UPI003CEA0CD5